jgi:hypothetical protein
MKVPAFRDESVDFQKEQFFSKAFSDVDFGASNVSYVTK